MGIQSGNKLTVLLAISCCDWIAEEIQEERSIRAHDFRGLGPWWLSSMFWAFSQAECHRG